MTSNVAIITGAGGGLGRSHAIALAREGWAVVVNDVNDPSAVVNEINDDAQVQAAGGKAIGAVAGVDTPEGAQTIVDAALNEFGRIDAVINNAGILRDKSFGKMTQEMLSDVLEVHLRGSFNVTHAAWDALKERGGSVVMTTSGSGLYGNFGQANYASAKMGLVGLTRALAIEGARNKVRVNAIAPLARSQMTENILAPELLERLDPEWVSPLVAYLASDSSEDTGNIYSVAGGRYARVALIEGPGVTFDHVPTIAEIAEASTKMNEIEGGTEPRSLTDQVELLQ